MTRGRTITFKYKHFKYDDNNIKKMLSVNLPPKDEQELNKIYNQYESLGVRRGYEYIIKDLYILVIKNSISTTDIAKIYDVGVRTVQIWLKELGLNRTPKEAQEIAVTKRDYKTIRSSFKRTMLDRMFDTQLNGSKVENYIRHQLNLLLTEKLKEYEVIVGINTLGIINMETDIPIIIIKDKSIIKFILEVDGYITHDTNKGIKRDEKKSALAKSKGYKLLRLDTKAYSSKDDIIYKSDLQNKLVNLIDEIIKEAEGI
ncbi:hypothetical protein [Clostridium sp. DJ247]|uniref:hypothetical protein n=1 Tax=Clostridium sp. DJ247 TaxID=2726188 RepID=UPI0016270B6A|nr:hypothetical protein [Clostridium sp. DJ247]